MSSILKNMKNAVILSILFAFAPLTFAAEGEGGENSGEGDPAEETSAKANS